MPKFSHRCDAINNFVCFDGPAEHTMSWTCSRCTFEGNSEADKRCGMCNGFKPTPVSDTFVVCISIVTRGIKPDMQ